MGYYVRKSTSHVLQIDFLRIRRSTNNIDTYSNDVQYSKDIRKALLVQ